MAAYSQPRIYSFRATAACGAYRVMKGGASEAYMQKATAATDKAQGISMSEATKADEMIEVALPGGGGKLILGVGGCAVGDLLVSDANGAGVVTSSANDKVIAKAMSAGVENDIIAVEVVASNY